MIDIENGSPNTSQLPPSSPTPSHSNDTTDPETPINQPSPSTFSTTSVFKHRSTKYRSLSQAEKSLPHSPHKRNEIVKLIASKHLKISLNRKGDRMKQALLIAEEEWLFSFLNRPDIFRQTPGRKDNVYIGKINGEKEYFQKRYLQ